MKRRILHISETAFRNMDADVVVVGAGPAGSVAAYALRRSGKKTILIDRLGESQFARYHSICGAAVAARSTKHLNLRPEEVLNKVNTLRIRFPGGNRAEMRINGVIIDRPKLLERLRQDAIDGGVQFIRGSVVSVEEDVDKYRITLHDGTAIYTKYLIGADGAHSIVRRDLFGTHPETMLKVEEYHSSAKAEDGVLDFLVSEKKAHFYQWYFPYRDGRCSGAVSGYADKEPDAVKGVRDIPMGWVPEIVKGNAMLIGDAAGLPNPVTAGGLSAAFLSGYNAAHAIIKDRPSVYSTWWKHSRRSDRRFTELHNTLSSYDDECLKEFAKYFTHKGLWINGIISVLHRPKEIGLYVGCLMCLKYGW